jgi:hypothetical protein
VASHSAKALELFVEAYRQGLGARAVARLSEPALRSDALAVVARVEAEIARLQSTGGLKTVNASYRQYRLAVSARGEPVIRYADWMQRYKADLIREIAENLR